MVTPLSATDPESLVCTNSSSGDLSCEKVSPGSVVMAQLMLVVFLLIGNVLLLNLLIAVFM